MSNQIGPANPNWKGGRVVDPRGYVLIRVGKNHPLADVRGYAYEHRLKAQEDLGRPLRPGEEVHHVDESRGNNSLTNLEIKSSRAEHAFEHRSERNKLRLRIHGAENPKVNCECGCGVEFYKFDGEGRPRRFVAGHNIHPR